MTKMEKTSAFSRRSVLKAGGALVVSVGMPIGLDTIVGINAAQAQGAVVSMDAKQILIEARREADKVLLSVTDHGIGIPEGDRRHAVERFVRLDSSRSQPGSGLGLSLASAVATLHGGELRLDDAHPGLVATLVIPARAGGTDRLAAHTHEVPQQLA